VQSDTEASSEDTDPEEDSNAVARRREEREVRKAISEKRVKRLRQKGRLVEQHRTVDQVTEWMDGMGYQNKVRPSQRRLRAKVDCQLI